MQHPTTPSAEFLKAIDEFNRRDYFQAHDSLEDLWMPETGPSRPFYQGLIQIAVGLLHTQRGNYKGAVSLLSQGIEKIRTFPSPYLGINSTALAEQTQTFLEPLEALGEGGLNRLPWDQAPVISLA